MGHGSFKVQLYVGDYALHGIEMTVIIKKDGNILHTLKTDENGTTEYVTLECPCLVTTSPAAGVTLYESYDVLVPAANGFMEVKVHGVQIFDDIPSVLNIHLEPYVEGESKVIEICIRREHGVDIDRDNGVPDSSPPRDGAMPDGTTADSMPEDITVFEPIPDPTPRIIPLANEVVVPEFITVHLGWPTATARQVRVPFRDYIVNVCCSEIYPHWERAAIEANVHAQVSFALNRLFTHWYPSRGRNFDITNVEQFDQVFVYGRNIFLNIEQIVNGIFNQFLRRPGHREPYLSSYCDGSPNTTWSRCSGMSQHGSQILAKRGFTPIQILRYYYPSDINIVQSTNFGPRNPGAYPGFPLREGSSGIDVRRMQLYLNRISGNWWIPPITNVSGIFGPQTRATVVAFQRLFNLNPDGVIGQATWYEITRVYVAARRMAELDSEGQRYSVGNVPPTIVLRQGARGDEVVLLQFLLNFIGQFYNEIPFVVEDSVFRDTTRLAVIEFQRRFGLNPDGVVGPITWNKLFEVYRRVRTTIPPTHPQPDMPAIPPFPGTPLQNGTRSESVRTLQSLLNGIARCYPSIEVLNTDGIFGPRTQAAVTEFQRLFGLTPSGIAGQDTWYRAVDEFNLLQNAPCPSSPPQPPTPPPPPPTPLPPYPGTPLRVGSRGEDVRTMQRFLNNIARVYPIIPGNLNEDGVFGPLTEASVRAFQTFFGLNSDGVIGPNTWARIVNVNAALPNIVAPQFPENLQVGSTGNNVRILQQYLNELRPNYPTLPLLNVDGNFGNITRSAVVAFQNIFGFAPSGTVDRTTWNFIVSLRNLLNPMPTTVVSTVAAPTAQMISQTIQTEPELETETIEAITVFERTELALPSRQQSNNRDLIMMLFMLLLLRDRH